MTNETFSFTGGKELAKALEQLGEAAGNRVARRALKKGAIPVRDKARQLAPKDENVLEEAIEIGSRLSKQARRSLGLKDDGVVWVYVGINQNAPQQVYIYAIVQEEGNADTAAQPFMRPAWAQKGPDAIRIIGPELWADIERTAKRAARKKAKAKG